MKTEVGVDVQDTTSSFATYIGYWVNNRYFDILRRTNWDLINESYTISLSAAATMASLPSDFGKEISVYDATNKKEIPFISIRDLRSQYPDLIDQSGDLQAYSIVDTVNSSNARYKYLKPFQIPTTAITLQFPYQIQPTALVSPADGTIIPCEDIIILGATADAWKYKRQFGKSQDMELLYERGINSLIWDKENQVNQVKTFPVNPYPRNII